LASFESDHKKELQPLTESSGGGIGKPPKPTAVGTGGFDNGDDAKKATRLDRYNIAKKWKNPPLISPTNWPLPNLGFYQLKVEKQSQSDRNAIAHSLNKLHQANSLMAHLVVSNGFEDSYCLGISYPTEGESKNARDRYIAADWEFLNSFSWPNIGIAKAIELDYITAQLRLGKPDRYVGCITGSPAVNGNGKHDFAAALQGIEYGILTLAAPVPPDRLYQEEVALRRVIEDDKPDSFDRCTERDRHLFEKIQNSAGTGVWQSCVLYFANAVNFHKLETALLQLSTAADKNTALTCCFSEDLAIPLDRLALPLSRAKHQDASSLTSYRYLTPLLASELAYFMTV
jgi:hypothetical protein